MPEREYAFYPRNSDKETLEEMIKHCRIGDYLEHEVNSLRGKLPIIFEDISND